MRSSATQVMDSTTRRIDIGMRWNTPDYLIISNNSDNVFWGWYEKSGSYNILVFSDSIFNIERHTSNGGLQYYTASRQTIGPYYVFEWSLAFNPSLYTLYTDVVYSSAEEVIAHKPNLVPEQPEADIFQLKDFEFATSFSKAQLGYLLGTTNEIYQLNYYITWSGIDNDNYVLTDVKYYLRAFTDNNIDPSDIGLSVLVDSGSCSSPFDYDVYSHIKNWNGGTDYRQFVLYLTPYSYNTQGVTNYIVCNNFTFDATFNSFGFLDVPTGELFGIQAVYSDGSIIPLVSPSTYVDSSDAYITSNSIDGIPIIGITYNTVGSVHNGDIEYVTHTENSYSPIIYITNDNSIQNYYDNHSSVINNNQSYNTIINNFANVDISDDDKGYIESIVDFLTMLVTFNNTMWSYSLIGLEFLPVWANTLITSIITLSSTVIIGLGILRLLKGL